MKRFFSIILLVTFLIATMSASAFASSKSVVAYVLKGNTPEYNSKGHVVCRHNVGEKVTVVAKKGNWCKLKNGHFIKFIYLSDNPVEYFLDKYDDIIFVSLSKQYLVYCKGGKIILESDVVTGDVSHHRSTHTGLYTIGHKKTDSDLMNNPYYHVQYFIGFNGKIGFHDAPWRTRFGGSIYKENGSHGCVNLPLKVAEVIYKKSKKDYTKVVILE